MRRTTSIFIGLVVLCAFFTFAYFQEEAQEFELYVEIHSDENEEVVRSWKNGNHYYVFLPGYVDLESAFLYANKEVQIDASPLVNGTACDEYEPDRNYHLKYGSPAGEQTGVLTFIRSGEIPVLHIDTQSYSMEYIHSKKGNEESGEIRLYDADGNLEYMGSLDSINGRGNSTWNEYDKKAYSVDFSTNVDLLGMGQAQRWVLLANASDPSNMKNKIVYDFAHDVGLEYSPESHWVDLYLNGEYAGVYLLSERNEVDPERVNISGEDSYLVSMELETRLQGKSYFVTNANQAIRVHYPSEVSPNDLETLKSTWQSIENAIISKDGIDSVTGKHWLEMIDLDSWAKKYLIEEVFENSDGCYASQYFYFDADSDTQKVFAGPVWDYDYSIDYTDADHRLWVSGLTANRLHVNSTHDTPWFYYLYQKEEFKARVVELYQRVFLPNLLELVQDRLGSYSKQISQASCANRVRWNIEEEIDSLLPELEAYFYNRISFLNSVWLEGIDYLQVRLDKGPELHYQYLAVKPGESIGELPVLISSEAQTFLGWYYKKNDEPVDLSQPIYEDTEIYAKWEGVSEVWWNRIGKLIPLGIVAVLLTMFFVVEIRRNVSGK